MPVLFVVAEIFTGRLLHAVIGPVIDAVAGGLTVTTVALVAETQGPAPSGSFVVHVNVMV